MEAIVVAQQVLGHLMRGHMPPREVTSLFISKMLGVGVLAGACVTKLPQVLAVLRARSVAGLSTLSLELELYVGLIHVCYGIFFKLPITAYGEAGVIWLQNLGLLLLVYSFTKVSPARPALVVAIISMVVTPVALDQVNAAQMARLYDLNSTVYLVSRLPQILKVFKEGKSGQLSVLTTLLMFVGAVVRVFTSMRENAGPAMVRGFMLGATINGIMLAQILYYGQHGRGKQVASGPQTRAKAKKVQ